MSIDYDRLRELLDETPPGPWLCERDGDEYEFVIGTADFGIITEVDNETDGRLIALAPDLAAELLRLRDGVEQMVYQLDPTQLRKDAISHVNVRYNLARKLDHLLKGDTE